MKCFRCFSFALFALLGVFFGSFIINQNDTYAVDPVTYHIDQSNLAGFDLCQNSCSLYHFIYFHNFTSNVTDPSFRNYIIFERSGSFSYPRLFLDWYPASPYSFILYEIDLSNNYLKVASSSTGGSFSFDVTLSENNPFSGSQPSGSLEITENGTYDVSQYAEAVVNVPETDCPSGGAGNYHDDLLAINNSIIICAATCLVIYFFYCIYRMIIKNSGVK